MRRATIANRRARSNARVPTAVRTKLKKHDAMPGLETDIPHELVVAQAVRSIIQLGKHPTLKIINPSVL